MPITINPRKINARKYSDGHSSVDGFLCHGWRRVSNRGSVRFHGLAWQDDRLKPFADQWVLVENGDEWGASIVVLPDGWGTSVLARVFIDEYEGRESAMLAAAEAPNEGNGNG